MRSSVQILVSFSLILFSSCLKEELPVAAHQEGDFSISQVAMGSDYSQQIYFNLNDKAVVKQNLKTDWDIAFECSDNGWHVVLNSSLGSAVSNTGLIDFNAVSSLSGNEQWNNDNPNGDLDSTAVGDYRNTNFVYVIDRGYNSQGTQLGYKKVVFNVVTNQQYEIRVAELDGSSDVTVSVTKDSTYNFLAFSFNSNSVIEIEPPKESWDLHFTQYTHIFYNPTMPYLVSGVLLNRNNTQVAVDSESEFQLISYDLLQQYDFSEHLNTIGYDWKSYDFNTSLYAVDQEKNFIIKNSIGLYFKLHFIDFYNDSGEKGYPKFALQQL